MIAARHIDALPRAVRTMLDAVGVSPRQSDVKGSALASYLSLESGYTGELKDLGYGDTQRQRAEVCAFFGWVDPGANTTQSGETTTQSPDRRKGPLRLR